MSELDRLAREHLYDLVKDNAKLSEQQCNAMEDIAGTLKSATAAYEVLHKQIVLHILTNEQFSQKVFELLSNLNENIKMKKKYMTLTLGIILFLSASVAILLGYPEAKSIIIKIIGKLL